MGVLTSKLSADYASDLSVWKQSTTREALRLEQGLQPADSAVSLYLPLIPYIPLAIHLFQVVLECITVRTWVSRWADRNDVRVPGVKGPVAATVSALATVMKPVIGQLAPTDATGPGVDDDESSPVDGSSASPTDEAATAGGEDTARAPILPSGANTPAGATTSPTTAISSPAPAAPSATTTTAPAASELAVDSVGVASSVPSDGKVRLVSQRRVDVGCKVAGVLYRVVNGGCWQATR